MWSFFRVWRRKVGVVTLVMALAGAGGWVRSRMVMDRLAHYTKTDWNMFTSFDSMLWFDNRHVEEGAPTHWPGVSFRWSIGLHGVKKWSPFYAEWSRRYEERPTINRYKLAGFDFGEYHFAYTNLTSPPTTYRCRVWGIPYWAVVVPLTLLSAYLILRKPRQNSRPAYSQ